MPCLTYRSGYTKKRPEKIDGLCTIAKAADVVNKNMKFFIIIFYRRKIISHAEYPCRLQERCLGLGVGHAAVHDHLHGVPKRQAEDI